MGKRQIKRILDVPSGGVLFALVVLATSFLLGGLIGCGLAASIAGDGNDTLVAYIQNYLAAAQAGMTRQPELVPLVWQIVRWPVLTLLLGFTAFGIVGIPVVFAVRGFLFSFAVASFIRMFGTAGAGLAFLIFGFSGLLSVPVLFVLGVHGWKTAFALSGRTRLRAKRSSSPEYIRLSQCGVCSVVLALCVFLEYFAVPALLSSMADRFII